MDRRSRVNHSDASVADRRLLRLRAVVLQLISPILPGYYRCAHITQTFHPYPWLLYRRSTAKTSKEFQHDVEEPVSCCPAEVDQPRRTDGEADSRGPRVSRCTHGHFVLAANQPRCHHPGNSDRR